MVIGSSPALSSIVPVAGMIWPGIMIASRAEGEPEAAEGGRGTSDAGQRLAAEAAESEAHADTDGMENGGCHDEAEGELPGAGVTEFAAMGVAMEEGEEADHG